MTRSNSYYHKVPEEVKQEELKIYGILAILLGQLLALCNQNIEMRGLGF